MDSESVEDSDSDQSQYIHQPLFQYQQQPIINPYKPRVQANYYGYRNPYQYQPLPITPESHYHDHIIIGIVIFSILGMCICYVGVKAGARVIEFGTAYKKELIAATLKANLKAHRLQQEINERESLLTHDNDNDNDTVTLVTDSNDTPQQDGN